MATIPRQPYRVAIPPEFDESLRTFILQELQKVETAFQFVVNGTPQITTVVPRNPQCGWLRFAQAPLNLGAGTNRWYYYGPDPLGVGDIDWYPWTGEDPGSTNFNDTVMIVNPQDCELLQYNASLGKWVNVDHNSILDGGTY